MIIQKTIYKILPGLTITILIIFMAGCGGETKEGGGSDITTDNQIQEVEVTNSEKTISAFLLPGETDNYKITVTKTATYNIFTSGTIDTQGILYNDAFSSIQENSDGGDETNFLISFTLNAGQTYYIAVKGFSTSTSGDYTLHIQEQEQAPTSPETNGENDGSEGEEPPIEGDVSIVLVWSYTDSETSEGPDIDLWVESPEGAIVSAENPTAVSGLELDFDDQGGYGSGEGGGPERILFNELETITGQYDYGVRWYLGSSGSIEYTIKQYKGTTLINTETGNLNAPNSFPGGEFIQVGSVIIN